VIDTYRDCLDLGINIDFFPVEPVVRIFANLTVDDVVAELVIVAVTKSKFAAINGNIESCARAGKYPLNAPVATY